MTNDKNKLGPAPQYSTQFAQDGLSGAAKLNLGRPHVLQNGLQGAGSLKPETVAKQTQSQSKPSSLGSSDKK
ncbi:MAG: hypothetical protein P4N59_05625 [Negativicutes bacterium]|nr:hypothetical protein [Negativicutes bacterium]